MVDSTLFPPNSPWLSDRVIGSVLQSKRKRYYEVGCADAFEPSVHGTYQSQELFRLRVGPTLVSSRPSDLQHPPPRAVRKENLIIRPQDQGNDVEAFEEDAAKLHRERRRLTQIRYRTKLRNHSDALDLEVRVLREEVQKLELQLQLISPRIIVDTTSWKIVAEYFRLFQFALTAYVPVSERCNALSSPCVYETYKHRDFLRTMAPGVIIDDDRGVEAMLERWRLVSISQPNFEIKVVRLENGPDGSIIATTKINIVMCKSMLQHTFPNLDKSERGRRLAAKLLGQPFEINGSIQFNWDNEKSCMLSLQHKSDVMMPIIRFLGDLYDVAFIFDQQYLMLLARRLLAPSA